MNASEALPSRQDASTETEDRVPEPDPLRPESTSDTREPWWRRWGPRWADLAIIVVVIGAWLRIDRWLDNHPLWLDEQMIGINIVQRDFAGLVGTLALSQSAPVGWLWAEHALAVIVEPTDHVLRFLPMATGVATLVVAWWIGRRWLGLFGALALVSLCSFAPYLLRYSDEVKQYSGDAFWALLLLALAAWALDSVTPLRRIFIWWAVALIGSWFSAAAILIAPGLVLVMLITLWRRQGWRSALWGVAGGVAWLASFAVQYLVSLRITLSSDFLYGYWRTGFAPQPLGVRSGLRWLASLPDMLAKDPILTDSVVAFWILAAIGIVAAIAVRRDLGALLISVPISAVVLATMRVVPLQSRLALWLVPTLFVLVAVAVALPARVAVALTRRAYRGSEKRWQRPALIVGALACVGVLVPAVLTANSVVSPMREEAAEWTNQPYGLNDRAAVAWLAEHRQVGDIVLISRHSVPAVAFYADGANLGFPYSLEMHVPGRTCAPTELRQLVSGHQRVLFYAGVRLQYTARGNVVMTAAIAQLGRVVETYRWGTGEIVVVDLKRPPIAKPSPILSTDKANCVKPARAVLKY